MESRNVQEQILSVFFFTSFSKNLSICDNYKIFERVITTLHALKLHVVNTTDHCALRK